MNEILKQVSDYGIVPVIKIDRVEDALPLAKALCDGGLPVAEITFRTACAEEAIRIIAKELPEMLVGAGTVLTCEQADRAIEAGAKFIVAPGLNPKVVKHVLSKNVPMLPGCSSPTDVEAAIELGLDTVKFFPAEAAGGLSMIKAMSAPYGSIKFMPTGGINETNILSYLQFSKIVACGGSFMVKDDLIHAGAFDQITDLTKKAVQLMLGFELVHIGINTEDDKQAVATAKLFADLFGMKLPEPGGKSAFCGPFEFMYGKGPGTHGHLAIGTNFPARAVAYLSRLGIAFDESTATYDEKGNLKFIYLKDEFCGFRVHLVKKK